MRIEKSNKLYKIASMLSPSIYETMFNSQYSDRSNKNTFLLGQVTFDKCYISERAYKMFLDSNKDRIKKYYHYLGLAQLHGSVVKSFEIDKNEARLLLEYTSIKNLEKNIKKIENLKSHDNDYTITIVFHNINHFSVNKLGKNEELIEVEKNLENLLYLRDQFVYIDEKYIEFAISFQNDKNELTYLLVSSKDIEIEDAAKKLWKQTFKDDFSMLYDYFINTNNAYPIETEDYFYKNIIESYKKFVKDLLDI